MMPLYTHCPHCAFPVVVNGIERVVPRRCRQCRGEYMPGVPLRRDPSARDARWTVAERQRAALYAQVKQRRRSLK